MLPNRTQTLRKIILATQLKINLHFCPYTISKLNRADHQTGANVTSKTANTEI